MGQQQEFLRRAWSPKALQKTAGFISETVKTSFSFMISRHPLERILSAYRQGTHKDNLIIHTSSRDKFFLNGDFAFERRKVDRFYNRYGKDIIAKYRKSKQTDPKYKMAPTFREFIEYLVDLPITKFNPHWIPMYLQCMPCHIQYSIIARLDTLTSDSEHIFKSIEVSAQLPKSHVTQGNTTDNTVASHYATLSKDLLDKLLDIYKFDILLFDYNIDEYVSYVKN